MARSSDGLQTWRRSVELDGGQLAEAWKEYQRTQSEEIRNLLIEHYLPIVKINSERLGSKLPDEVEIDDLISAGIDGLRDAIKMFDLDRGVKFETYCATRIRGAILDALRNKDWVPRLVRARANQLGQSRRRLEAELGRRPSTHELAAYMRLSERNFEKLLRDAHAVGVISLNRNFQDAESSREIRETDLVADRRAPNPMRAVHQDDVKNLITKGLSKNERLILILYYYEEMTMKEIGATLDLSESRVSQMHSAIVERLRLNLEDRRDDFLHPEP